MLECYDSTLWYLLYGFETIFRDKFLLELLSRSLRLSSVLCLWFESCTVSSLSCCDNLLWSKGWILCFELLLPECRFLDTAIYGFEFGNLIWKLGFQFADTLWSHTKRYSICQCLENTQCIKLYFSCLWIVYSFSCLSSMECLHDGNISERIGHIIHNKCSSLGILKTQSCYKFCSDRSCKLFHSLESSEHDRILGYLTEKVIESRTFPFFTEKWVKWCIDRCKLYTFNDESNIFCLSCCLDPLDSWWCEFCRLGCSIEWCCTYYSSDIHCSRSSRGGICYFCSSHTDSNNSWDTCNSSKYCSHTCSKDHRTEHHGDFFVHLVLFIAHIPEAVDPLHVIDNFCCFWETFIPVCFDIFIDDHDSCTCLCKSLDKLFPILFE